MAKISSNLSATAIRSILIRQLEIDYPEGYTTRIAIWQKNGVTRVYCNDHKGRSRFYIDMATRNVIKSAQGYESWVEWAVETINGSDLAINANA